jgi:hypothetical protein
MERDEFQQEHWEVQVEGGAQLSPNLSDCSFPDCSFPGKESPTPNVRRISPTAIARPNGCFFLRSRQLAFSAVSLILCLGLCLCLCRNPSAWLAFCLFLLRCLPSLPLSLLTPLTFSRMWHVAYGPGLRCSYLYVCMYTPSNILH